MTEPAQSNPTRHRFNIQPLPDDSFTYFHIPAAAFDLSNAQFPGMKHQACHPLLNCNQDDRVDLISATRGGQNIFFIREY
jgi:hypothetical protein